MGKEMEEKIWKLLEKQVLGMEESNTKIWMN